MLFVLGVGYRSAGRKYLLPRPSHEEVEFVLWRMIFGLRMREEEVRIEEKEERVVKEGMRDEGLGTQS